MNEATCIGCTCSDYNACINGRGEACSWLRIDREEARGVCSMCPEEVARFDEGDRRLRDPFAGQWGSAQDVVSRIDMVRKFNRQACRLALQVPHLQKTVRTAVERRLRELAKGASRG